MSLRLAILFLIGLIASALTTATRSSLSASPRHIAAFWANDGTDKVTKDEQRALRHLPGVTNTVWNGSRIALFGARNEVVAFNMILETSTVPASSVRVTLPSMIGPAGFRLEGKDVNAGDVFDWLHRDIELFYVRYLQVRGLSRLSYDFYDERHIPARLRRPQLATGAYHGGWVNRPARDKYYPDIAVPLELVRSFNIPAKQNQSVWADIYIPKNAPAGVYRGSVSITANGVLQYRVPVFLTVRNFALPDLPASRTMVATSFGEVARRYTGGYPAEGSAADKLTKLVMDRQMLLAHRHKISLIDDNDGTADWAQYKPRAEWIPRLSGGLFTPAHGYKGPGVGVGNNVFSIGIYGNWQRWWNRPNRAQFWRATDQWENWFAANSLNTERFLYLIDESLDYNQTETWAKWLRTNPGTGRQLRSFATVDLPDAQRYIPSLDLTGSFMGLGETETWKAAVRKLRTDPRKRLYLYNGQRPASGSFAIEDEGVALRELAWGQYKMGVARWFYWAATYYDNRQHNLGPTNVFRTAQTFGGRTTYDARYGMVGVNSSNGEGVLFYPGTDKVYPAESYNLAGPIASLRMKHWRRGIQDVDYLALAAKIDPARTAAIVGRMVPKVLWEVGVSNIHDPTWVISPIRWSINPTDWEKARAELANIIELPRPLAVLSRPSQIAESMAR